MKQGLAALVHMDWATGGEDALALGTIIEKRGKADPQRWGRRLWERVIPATRDVQTEAGDSGSILRLGQQPLVITSPGFEFHAPYPFP